MQRDHDKRYEEDQVDQASGDVHGQSEDPKDDEDDTDDGEHSVLEFARFLKRIAAPSSSGLPALWDLWTVQFPRIRTRRRPRS